jgi:hypothetical protein
VFWDKWKADRYSTRDKSYKCTPKSIYGIISPLYAEMMFIIINNVGIAVLVLSGIIQEELKQQR